MNSSIKKIKIQKQKTKNKKKTKNKRNKDKNKKTRPASFEIYNIRDVTLHTKQNVTLVCTVVFVTLFVLAQHYE